MTMTMRDPSDQRPAAGWLFGLLPRRYWRDPTVLQAVCAGLDSGYDARLVALRQLQFSRYVDDAVGADLDAIGTAINIPRYADQGESDDVYRPRLKATARRGLGAATAGAMPQALTEAFGVPFIISSGVLPARFTVFALGPLAVPAAVMPLVKRIKLAGTIPTGFRLVAARLTVGESTGLVGTSLVGDTLVGGNAHLAPLQ